MKTENINFVEAARGVLRAAGYFVDHLWHANDIHFICEQLDMDRLSDEEIAEVMTIVAEGFDGDTGISWPQLERAIQQFQQRREAVREMTKATAKPRVENLW